MIINHGLYEYMRSVQKTVKKQGFLHPKIHRIFEEEFLLR